MDCVLGKVIDQSHCRAYVKVIDLALADDIVLLRESLEVLVMVLKVLHKQLKAMGVKFSWAKTKVQFRGLLGEIVQSVQIKSPKVPYTLLV